MAVAYRIGVVGSVVFWCIFPSSLSRNREMNYLDFTAFYQRAVQLLPGALRVHARLKRYKTKAL